MDTIPPSEGGGAGSIPAGSTNEVESCKLEVESAKEPGEKHWLEPYFNFGGKKIFNLIN